MRTYWATALSLCAMALAGCSGMPRFTSTETTGAVHGVALHGMVHGGQQPIVGASVYLYALSASSYDNPSVSLLTAGSGTTKDSNNNYYVTSGTGGAFSISGDYTCPSTSTQVYLYSSGGNSGYGTNSAITLMAAVGSCGNLKSTTYIVMNEVSTVATAYALAPFALSPTEVSTSSTALAATDAANAFATVTNLETLGTGVARSVTPAGNGTVPQAEINTLANILGACINSAGGSTSPCPTLLQYALNPDGLIAGDTATAAMFIAQDPWQNISTLFGLQTASAPFQPMLSAAPNDFTIAVNYTNGSFEHLQGLAVDGSGNVWVTYNGSATLGEFSPLGAASHYTENGLDFPAGLAIDTSGNIWVADSGNSELSEFTSAGGAATGSPFSGGGMDDPSVVAIDNGGNIWVMNSGSDVVSEFDSSGGSEAGTTGYPSTGMDAQGMASYGDGVWVSSYSGGVSSVFIVDSLGSAGAEWTGGGLDGPEAIAFGPIANFVVNEANSTLWCENGTDTSGSGTTCPSGFVGSGGGLDMPGGIISDGLGDFWIANQGNNTISEFNDVSSDGTPITGSTGYQGGGLDDPIAIAVDGSGNVWVGNYASSAGSVTEFVGAAHPVVTPLAANWAYGEPANYP
jgi:hypothetical protein